MSMKGIDVSKHQGTVNWSHVKADGVKFAIIRAGYGKQASQKDAQFENNYAGCKSNGVPVGVYWYSYATTPDEARKEAAVCLSVIKGVSGDGRKGRLFRGDLFQQVAPGELLY